jgi:hypothetical protein
LSCLCLPTGCYHRHESGILSGFVDGGSSRKRFRKLPQRTFLFVFNTLGAWRLNIYISYFKVCIRTLNKWPQLLSPCFICLSCNVTLWLPIKKGICIYTLWSWLFDLLASWGSEGDSEPVLGCAWRSGVCFCLISLGLCLYHVNMSGPICWRTDTMHQNQVVPIEVHIGEGSQIGSAKPHEVSSEDWNNQPAEPSPDFWLTKLWAK